MKKWPLIVAGLYGLVLLTLFVPLLLIAFQPVIRVTDIQKALASGWLWFPIVIMVLAQFALLRIPVHIASRRPVTRRPLLITIVAAAFMMGLLGFGAAGCVYEFLASGIIDESFWWWVGAGAASWAFWAVYFHRSTKRAEPDQIVNRLRRFMRMGSILEFLIAIPTHIVARHRDYCCAGFMTFMGLACGISVMVFAFGPAVYFLFVERWKRLHPNHEHQSEAVRADQG